MRKLFTKSFNFLEIDSCVWYLLTCPVPQSSILGPTHWWCYLWYCYLCYDTNLYSKCDQGSDLWQQLELASELKTGLWETLSTGAGSGLLIAMQEKLSWCCFTDLIILVLMMWKWMGLFLRKTYIFRCWGWPFSSNLELGLLHDLCW